MPDTTDDPDALDGEDAPAEQKGVGNRLGWFFGIAVVSGLVFAGAAGILRWLILH
jgi:hypothetical protein